MLNKSELKINPMDDVMYLFEQFRSSRDEKYLQQAMLLMDCIEKFNFIRKGKQ